MLSASAIRSAPEARAAVRWGRRAGQSRATGNAGRPAVGERAVRGAWQCGVPGSEGAGQCGAPGGGGAGGAGCPAVREPRSSGGEGICEGWFKGSFYFLF